MHKRAELQKVLPVLPARDVDASIRFYVERLGFALAFRDPTDPDHYAGVRRDGIVLHLQFQFEKDFLAGTAGQAMLRIVVDDATALFDEYRTEVSFTSKRSFATPASGPASSRSGTSTGTA